jgi:MtN3 and saliva related transmembrane protein
LIDVSTERQAALDVTKIIGYSAALLTTISFLPQVIRTIRTRSARDLSIGMLVLFLAGIGMWLVYGLMTNQMPIIAANGTTLLLVIILCICKFIYK